MWNLLLPLGAKPQDSIGGQDVGAASGGVGNALNDLFLPGTGAESPSLFARTPGDDPDSGGGEALVASWFSEAAPDRPTTPSRLLGHADERAWWMVPPSPPAVDGDAAARSVGAPLLATPSQNVGGKEDRPAKRPAKTQATKGRDKRKRTGGGQPRANARTTTLHGLSVGYRKQLEARWPFGEPIGYHYVAASNMKDRVRIVISEDLVICRPGALFAQVLVLAAPGRDEIAVPGRHFLCLEVTPSRLKPNHFCTAVPRGTTGKQAQLMVPIKAMPVPEDAASPSSGPRTAPGHVLVTVESQGRGAEQEWFIVPAASGGIDPTPNLFYGHSHGGSDLAATGLASAKQAHS